MELEQTEKGLIVKSTTDSDEVTAMNFAIKKSRELRVPIGYARGGLLRAWIVAYDPSAPAGDTQPWEPRAPVVT